MDNGLKEWLQAFMNQFEKRFDSVDQRLDGIDRRLTGIEEEQTLMKQDINGIKQDVQEIKEDQHLIKSAVLDTNERVMKMESVLENQHSIIELLSARSIQQEAELKRIK